MPTRAELVRHSRAQNDLVDKARRELRALVAMLPSDPAAATQQLEEIFPVLVRTYGDAGVTVAAEFFEATAKRRPRVTLGGAVPREQAAATARWAAQPLWRDGDPQKTLALLLGATQRYVRAPGRDTIRKSARRSGARYARVPTKSDPCAWCVMLASRGDVYHTKETAGGTKDWHDDCGCEATAIWGPDDLPEGYDPDDLYAQYLAGRAAVDAKWPSTKQILAEMRSELGLR